MPRRTLISWNVNGLRAIHKKGFLEWLTRESPDMLCLQETKASPDQLPDELLNINGYSCWFSSAQKKGYSGVAIYSKQEPVNVYYGFGDPRFDNEGRILIAEYPEFALFQSIIPTVRPLPSACAIKWTFIMRFWNVPGSSGTGDAG